MRRRLTAGRSILLTLLVVTGLLASACGSDGDTQDRGSGSVTPIGEFTSRQGLLRQYFLVSPKLTDQQIVTIATRLHDDHPEAWLWLMDDDAQMPQLLKALPATERGDLSTYPSLWVDQHTVAHSVITVGGGPRQWVLFAGAGTGTELVTLPR